MSFEVASSYLHALRKQTAFTWKSMVCELIDNAFDANANEVRLSWPGGKVFEISDDGCGTEDLMRLLHLGRRMEHETNDIGKYGIGSKYALIWLWGVSEIESRTSQSNLHISVDWEQVASDIAPYPSQMDIQELEPNGRTGTKLRALGEKSYPKFDELFASLGSTYTPGLELGKRIFVRKPGKQYINVVGRSFPKTAPGKLIEDVIEAAGREVRIKIGIVQEGECNPFKNGFSFERTYRVIKESTLGANGFSVSRLAGRITLGKDWGLSTNKDDLQDFQDELGEAIYNRCSELMKEASEQAISHEDAMFNRELAQKIVGCGTRREKRKKGSSSGSVEPKHTGRKRQRAQETTDNDGSVIEGMSRSKSGFTVETYEDDSSTVGYYDEAGNRVRLNISNSFVKKKHRAQDADTLLSVVYGILAQASIQGQADRSPLFKSQIEGDFFNVWGQAIELAAETEQSK